ncbi:gluconate kinase, SKI family [Tranquillimonas rosea]|uniref:Gluconokinase n=1 Tax=Tranquillimonas rosea TaxID=641238 RepID=A0A1H9RDX1_9RHOB|nr:gluconokinase [Tranquillimonas rosea]SER70946.1 gluconate kinase, SKI family [Tranquillimonas rosea]
MNKTSDMAQIDGARPDRPTAAILVTGICGSGKSTIAQHLAHRLGAAFVEGDDHHPPENVKAMSSGTPLSDEMRAPWLDALAAAATELQAVGDVVITCSALKRRYRDRLARDLNNIVLVHLTAPRPVIEERMSAREHFMPTGLIDSQIAALELPAEDERPITIDVSGSLEDILDTLTARLRERLGEADGDPKGA